jgi:acetylglutamate kinase
VHCELCIAESIAESIAEKVGYQVLVVKFSGKVFTRKDCLANLLENVAVLFRQGVPIALVHGGGSSITKTVEERGGLTRFWNGLRVTDELTLEVVREEMAQINAQIVEMLEDLGVIVESHADGERLIKARKKIVYEADGTPVDLGFVGEVAGFHTEMMESFIAGAAVPVIAPLGMDEQRNIYNINADDAAQAVAIGFSARQFILLSDVDGVYLQEDGGQRTLPCLTPSSIYELHRQGQITDGMLPKLNGCQEAIRRGVSSVRIANGMTENVLLRILEGETLGTEIISDVYSVEVD